jgi:hypothetical protein
MVLLRNTDAISFKSQLESSSIEVINAPESLPDWEHALLTGSAELKTITTNNADERLDNGPPGWHSFPIVVVGSNETYPITTATSLVNTDELIVITRPSSSKVPASLP